MTASSAVSVIISGPEMITDTAEFWETPARPLVMMVLQINNYHARDNITHFNVMCPGKYVGCIQAFI